MRLLIELKVFRERLRELAYIEGQNITIEPRYGEGKIELLPNTVAELVGLKCDCHCYHRNGSSPSCKKRDQNDSCCHDI